MPTRHHDVALLPGHVMVPRTTSLLARSYALPVAGAPPRLLAWQKLPALLRYPTDLSILV